MFYLLPVTILRSLYDQASFLKRYSRTRKTCVSKNLARLMTFTSMRKFQKYYSGSGIFASSRMHSSLTRESNRILINDGDRIRVQKVEEHYVLPNDLQKYIPYVIGRTTGNPWPFNGRILRLRTDPVHQVLEFQPVSYFDGLCSNDLMKFRVDGKRQGDYWSSRHMTQDNGELCSLNESTIANIVGVSTLAISTDGKIIVVMQNRMSSSSSFLNAPSGSGSIDEEDMDNCETLNDLVTCGAIRELREEVGIPEDLLTETKVIGYSRWLERGGKPEFFAVTYLTKSADEVDALLEDIGARERLYTGSISWVSVEDACISVMERRANELTMDQQIFRNYASHPLIEAIRFLDESGILHTRSVNNNRFS